MLNWKLAEHLYAMRCVQEDEEDKKKFQRILDLLDVDDDVQDVYTNCAED